MSCTKYSLLFLFALPKVDIKGKSAKCGAFSGYVMILLLYSFHQNDDIKSHTQ